MKNSAFRSALDMKLFWITLTIAILVIVSSADAKRKRKFEGDFEFADEVRY